MSYFFSKLQTSIDFATSVSVVMAIVLYLWESTTSKRKKLKSLKEQECRRAIDNIKFSMDNIKIIFVDAALEISYLPIENIEASLSYCKINDIIANKVMHQKNMLRRDINTQLKYFLSFMEDDKLKHDEIFMSIKDSISWFDDLIEIEFYLIRDYLDMISPDSDFAAMQQDAQQEDLECVVTSIKEILCFGRCYTDKSLVGSILESSSKEKASELIQKYKDDADKKIVESIQYISIFEKDIMSNENISDEERDRIIGEEKKECLRFRKIASEICDKQSKEAEDACSKKIASKQIQADVDRIFRGKNVVKLGVISTLDEFFIEISSKIKNIFI